MERYGRTRQATGHSVIRRREGAIGMAFNEDKNAHTHSRYICLLLFHGNNGYANARHCYVIRTFPVMSFATQNLWAHVVIVTAMPVNAVCALGYSDLRLSRVQNTVDYKVRCRLSRLTR